MSREGPRKKENPVWYPPLGQDFLKNFNTKEKKNRAKEIYREIMNRKVKEMAEDYTSDENSKEGIYKVEDKKEMNEAQAKQVLKHQRNEIKKGVKTEVEAERDGRTDLLTETAFRENALEEELDYLKENEEKTSLLLFFDLDNFSEINDKFGHTEANKILKAISNVIRHNIRVLDKAGILGEEREDTTGVAGREGGDEFVVLLHDIESNQIEKITKRLFRQLSSINLDRAQKQGEDFEVNTGEEVTRGDTLDISLGARPIYSGENLEEKNKESILSEANDAEHKSKETGNALTIVTGVEGERQMKTIYPEAKKGLVREEESTVEVKPLPEKVTEKIKNSEAYELLRRTAGLEKANMILSEIENVIKETLEEEV